MAEIRALIVGVNDYIEMGQNDLPFCSNDIYAINTAFIKGLGAQTENIILLGDTGVVQGEIFVSALQQLSNIADNEDTLLLYFSGHGGTIEGNHYLLLSNTMIRTQEVITYLEAIPAKNKIVFLDCCMAGDFTVDGTAIFNANQTADEFAGKGYAVIASSNATQVSWGHPEKPISLFTSFLCEALTNNVIVREGKKTLYDIKKLLFLYLEIWNKNNPAKVQNPIYRANIGGTIFFNIQEYHPYVVGSFFAETEKYFIFAVEPTHSSIAKRYSVKVILKAPFSFYEIAQFNHEIVEKVKYLNIYRNEIQQKRWSGKNASLIFCYFGLDETDIINGNYICHTTWVDETQDRNWWYRIFDNCEVINNIHFNIHSYYQSLKTFTEEHTGTKECLIKETRRIMSSMITLTEQVISLYNEFLNEVCTEDAFIANISGICSEIEKLYFIESNQDIPPNDLKNWCQCCSNLAATIHDMTLYYGTDHFLKRTSENRKACMDISIKQYYKELEVFKTLDTCI